MAEMAEMASTREGWILAANVVLRCFILGKYSQEILWQSLNLLIWQRISCYYRQQIFFSFYFAFFVERNFLAVYQHFNGIYMYPHYLLFIKIWSFLSPFSIVATDISENSVTMCNCFTMDGNIKEIFNKEPDPVTRLRNSRAEKHFWKKLQNHCLAFHNSPVMCGWVSATT